MFKFYFIFCILLKSCVAFRGHSSLEFPSEFKPPTSSMLSLEKTEQSPIVDHSYTTAEFSSIEVLSARNHIKYGSTLDFFGKVVLVTGATSSLGRTIALYFARLGASLSLTGRDFKKLYRWSYKAVRKIATVKPHIPRGELNEDMLAQYVIQYTINRFGKLDVLVNCAGKLEFGDLNSTSVFQFNRMIDNNVKTTFLVSKYAVPHLEKTNGTIVTVSSMAGLRPYPGLLAFCMSKAAVDQLTKCLALELAPRIRVNSVNPNVVVSNMHLKNSMSETMYRQYLNNSEAKNILGRIVTKKDIARAVAYLASDKASFITGVNFPVDGGQSIMCP